MIYFLLTILPYSVMLIGILWANRDDFYKFLCWIDWHDNEVIDFTNLYKGDLGMVLRCRRCKKESIDNGQPMW